jgi:uncharacterized membrane protein YiaA
MAAPVYQPAVTYQPQYMPSVSSQAYQQQATQARRSGYSNSGGHFAQMMIGLVILVIGLAVTIGTYAAATSTPSGGRYTIAYGAIIVGAIRFFTGLSRWISSR